MIYIDTKGSTNEAMRRIMVARKGLMPPTCRKLFLVRYPILPCLPPPPLFFSPPSQNGVPQGLWHIGEVWDLQDGGIPDAQRVATESLKKVGADQDHDTALGKDICVSLTAPK